jgi:hypothetical protein
VRLLGSPQSSSSSRALRDRSDAACRRTGHAECRVGKQHDEKMAASSVSPTFLTWMPPVLKLWLMGHSVALWEHSCFAMARTRTLSACGLVACSKKVVSAVVCAPMARLRAEAHVRLQHARRRQFVTRCDHRQSHPQGEDASQLQPACRAAVVNHPARQHPSTALEANSTRHISDLLAALAPVRVQRGFLAPRCAAADTTAMTPFASSYVPLGSAPRDTRAQRHAPH